LALEIRNDAELEWGATADESDEHRPPEDQSLQNPVEVGWRGWFGSNYRSNAWGSAQLSNDPPPMPRREPVRKKKRTRKRWRLFR
jgi:hypothetical protein